MTTVGNSSESPTTSRSIISRITSPFKAKPRHVSDYYIKVDEPHRRYSPGDIVKGSIILTLQKPLRITHIVLCLHGFVRVFKNPIAPGEGLARDGGFMGAGRGQRGPEYFGNGFASIFEDEIVLHGETRLSAATWTLGFEMEFPPTSIPSSIDFERGTISYMLTSTLTRPVTLNPTITCDRKIYLVDTVEIARLRKPKSRIISLEPIPRRPRHRASGKQTLSQDNQSSATAEFNARSRLPLNDARSVRSSEGVCQSPVPSEISSIGAESSSNASFRIRSGPSVPPSSVSNEPQACGTPRQDKIITAAVELLHGGCLPGDTLSVRISIDHSKPIVSMNGIIVTLYRQGRVDMHPALPLGPSEPGKKPQYEDYYPKSRTGLGGLSLSSAASTQGFRMDLDQSFTPLIVDPNTLTADVKASVRVPDNVFPTISNTPGSMISFSYYIEVIIDLRGKLTIPDRILPRLGLKDSPKMHGYMDTTTWRSVGLPDPFHGQGTNFADTDQIRREKSVVACSFEVLVGTKDSARKGVKRTGEHQEPPEIQQVRIPVRGVEKSGENTAMHDDQNQPDDSTPREDRYNQRFEQEYYDENQSDHDPQPADVTRNVLLPETEEPQDEKSRIRRAEVQLLPSAPPMNDGDFGSSSNVPSAPPPGAFYPDYNPSLQPALRDNFGTLRAEASPVYARAGPSSAPPFPSLTSSQTALPHHSPPHGGSDHAIEDKQELERRRLMAEESAPPLDDGDEYDGHAAEDKIEGLGMGRHPTGASHTLPSAPILSDEGYDCCEGEGGSTNFEAAGSSSSAAHRRRLMSETLPRYQK